MTGLYRFYLQQYQMIEPEYHVSPITELVANHSVTLGNMLGFHFSSLADTTSLSVKLLTDNHHVANIVEGCNAISVIILFLAFIIAFSGKLKYIIGYGIWGVISIYVLNIFRIVLITVALDKYPQHSGFLHQIVFPAIIYGYTFLLWVLWVRYFTEKKSKK